MDNKTLNIGILGSGMIVPVFINAAKKIEGYQIRAIWGRNEEKLKDLKKEYKINVVYTDIKEFMADSKINAVYVALPNALHYEYAKMALTAGKHVIVEKPFTTNYKQAKEIINLAEKKKLLIFEAITTMHLPNYQTTKGLLENLGEIKYVSLNYTQYSSRYDAFKRGDIQPAFSNELAGGALMDLGIYNIHFVVGLFGKPKKVKYYPHIEEKIDTSGILIMEYPTFRAVCVAAKDCDGSSGITIAGEKGAIVSNYPANYYQSFEYKLHKQKVITINLDEEFSFSYELKEFLRMYQENDLKKCQEYNKQTLLVMDVVNMVNLNGHLNVLPLPL